MIKVFESDKELKKSWERTMRFMRVKEVVIVNARLFPEVKRELETKFLKRIPIIIYGLLPIEYYPEIQVFVQEPFAVYLEIPFKLEELIKRIKEMERF